MVAGVGPGSRILVKEDLATVRWGPGVLPSQGEDEWLGIEYDSEGKGKHDGIHTTSGQRFFQCVTGKGSFVKVKKAGLGVDYLS